MYVILVLVTVIHNTEYRRNYMALYLIDFENVHDSGLNGINALTDQDEVSIFYSNKSEHMSFDTHVNIMKSEARIKYIKLRRSAKNYLDFQLCTHLGYLIGSQTEGPFFIISKDTGYDSIIDYWRDHGITVTRQPSIGFNSMSNRATGQTIIQAQPAKVDVQENNHVITLPSVPVYFIGSSESKKQSEDENAEEAISENSEAKSCEAEAPISEAQTSESISSQSDELPFVKTAKSRSKSKARTRSKSNIAEDDSSSEEPISNISESESTNADAGSEVVLLKPDALPEAYRKKVRTALRGKNIPSGNYSAIYKAVVNSYDKLALNNILVKSFGSSKGGVVYNMIKDIFTEYHSS